MKIEGNNQRVMACRFSLFATFENQAKDKKEQATHSECDPLDDNEGFDLDNSA